MLHINWTLHSNSYVLHINWTLHSILNMLDWCFWLGLGCTKHQRTAKPIKLLLHSVSSAQQRFSHKVMTLKGYGNHL